MWDIVAIVALSICCMVGIMLTALRLPGSWLVVVAALVYGWWSDWQDIGLVLVAVLAGIALIGEATEFALSAITAKKAGASRQAVWGGLAGGILGMLFLSSLLSLPLLFVGTLIGAVAGALVGCFIGATLVEYAVRKRLAQGTKVGIFSAVGFVLGMVTKVALVLIMSALVLTSVVCSPPDSGETIQESSASAPWFNIV